MQKLNLGCNASSSPNAQLQTRSRITLLEELPSPTRSPCGRWWLVGTRGARAPGKPRYGAALPGDAQPGPGDTSGGADVPSCGQCSCPGDRGWAARPGGGVTDKPGRDALAFRQLPEPLSSAAGFACLQEGASSRPGRTMGLYAYTPDAASGWSFLLALPAFQ